jgi:hypothetical protein
MIAKYPSPQRDLLTLHRVIALNQSATQQRLMWTEEGRHELNHTLTHNGIISFQNEIQALGKYLSLGVSFMHTGKPITDDIQAIYELM